MRLAVRTAAVAACVLVAASLSAAPASARPTTQFNVLGQSQALRMTVHDGRASYQVPRRANGIGAALVRSVRRGTSTRQALRTALAASLVRLGAPAGLMRAELAAGAAVAGSGFYAEPVGDLDGDGRSDLLGYTFDAQSGAIVVAALRGTDGKELWRTSFTSDFGAAIPMRLGPAGTPGVLFAMYSFGDQDAQVGDVYTPKLDLTAVSGLGVQLWQKSYSGHGAFDYVGLGEADYQVPWLAGTFQATRTPAEDLLVTVDSDAFLPTGNYVASEDATVLDGADASTVSTATVRTQDQFPFSTPVQDLSGDGLDDYLLVSATDSAGTISARRGTDGGEVWNQSNTPAGWYSFEDPVGDLTGDGRSDFLVQGFSFDPGSGFASTIALLSGADGTTVWSVAADAAAVLGDLSGDGLPEVGTASFLDGNDAVGVRYQALDAAGDPVYTSDYTVPVSASDSYDAEVQLWLGIGDVQPDGVPDGWHDVEVADLTTHTFGSDERIVSGATGQPIRTGSVGFPLAASVDGTGDDFVTIADGGSGTTSITTQDGATGRDLWTSAVPSPQGDFSYLWVDAADLTGDGHAELVVDTVGLDDRGNEVDHAYVLDGSSGATLWSV